MKNIIVIVILSLCGMAQAQNSSFISVCKEQITALCGTENEKKESKEILKCLSKNEERLSQECKQEIQRAAKVIRQTTPPGGGPLGMLGGMTSIGPLVPMLLYEGRLVPSDEDKKRSPSITENNLRLSIPVYKSDTQTVSTSLSNSLLHLDKGVTLSSGLKLPSDFYRSEVGLQYTRRMEGQKSYGFQGNFGYTGDEFNSETQSYSFNANYSYPGSKGGHWVLMLIFSNNNPLGDGVPIPGFFYIHRTPTFTGVFGLPVMSMQWTPVNPWSFSLSALGPVIRSEASYGTIDETQYFLGLSWNQQRYMLSERKEEDDRLTFEEKRAELGLRRPFGDKVYAELKVGYAFDRSIYMGEKLFDKAGGEAGLGNSWFAGWTLRVLF